MNFCSIQFLKNTKNIYAFWYVQKSCLCYPLTRLGVPIPPLNLKIKLGKSKTAQKVIKFRFPLEFHCKLCMSALRNRTQFFRNVLRSFPRGIRIVMNIVWRGLWVILSLNINSAHRPASWLSSPFKGVNNVCRTDIIKVFKFLSIPKFAHDA